MIINDSSIIDEIDKHFGHNVVVSWYVDDADNVREIAIECEDCYETLVSFARDPMEDYAAGQITSNDLPQ